MAIVNVSSFDAQFVSSVGGGGATTALSNRKVWDGVGATAPTMDTTTFLHGTTSAKWTAAAASSGGLSTTINGTTGAASAGWFRLSSGTISGLLNVMRFSGAATGLDIRINTDGVAYLMTTSIDGSQVALFTPVVDTWYWISLVVDVSANPQTQVGRVYNTSNQQIASASRSVAVAADTITQIQLGSIQAGRGVDLYCDSFIVTDTAATITPRKIQLLTPTNGTHSFTANDFQNQASGNLTTASDIAALVDDYPPSLTDFVKQVVARSTAYCEFAFTDLVTTGLDAAEYVQLAVASHPVGANGPNESMFRLVDGSTVTAEALADMTAATDTLEYHRHGYTTAPSTSGAWSNTLVNALLARWGFGAADVSPPPALDSIWLEVSSPFTLAGTGKKAQMSRPIANRIALKI